MQCLCVNMIWIVYLVVTVLLNKSGAQDINKTGKIKQNNS